MKADMAARLAWQCEVAGLPKPEREYRFTSTRKWRFDLAFPDDGLAVEVEGIVYPKRGQGYGVGGRHGSVKGFKADIEKYGEAFALGWSVLRILPEHVTNGQALMLLERRLNKALTLAALRAGRM